MRLIHLLYIDLHLPKGLILDAFAKCIRPQVILLDNSFESLLRTTEIKKYIESGSIVPSHLIEQLIEQNIDPTSTQDILILGYPRLVHRLESFEHFARAKELSISRCWYFKHADFDLFIKNKKKAWIAKHGDSTTDHWVTVNKTIEEVELLKSRKKHLWIEVELTSENYNLPAYVEQEILKNIGS